MRTQHPEFGCPGIRVDGSQCGRESDPRPVGTREESGEERETCRDAAIAKYLPGVTLVTF